MNLSVVILTKNEEENISGCIKALDFCDEIILIDDYSTDNTTEIARKFGAKVYKRSLNNNFASQRNFGLEKAKGKWVFFVDADEEVTSGLKDEIIQAVNNPLIGYSGFYLIRRDFLWSRKMMHSEHGALKLLRLGKRKAGRWMRAVHEYWSISGKKRTLVNPLLHYPHKSVADFIDNINKFSTLHALANNKEGKRSNLVKIVIWPFGKFVYNYLLRFGFRDKTKGFVAAVLMCFHSFLAWSKLWFLQKKGFTKI